MSFNICANNEGQGPFHISNRGWFEIAERCMKVAPELMAKMPNYGTNDGDGLDEKDCLELALRLETGLAHKTIDDWKNAVADFAAFLKDCKGFELW
jgi:hypothetical protein